jgi:cell division protein FtsW (lipid II flippase)
LKLNSIRQNYGIYIIALWAIVLGVQNLTNLLLISSSTQNAITQTPSASSILFYQLVSVGFSLGFFVASVGLWRKANWGRFLFLITVVLFFMVSTVGLFTPRFNTPTTQEKWWLSTRYALSTILPLVYLNWGPVKDRFNPTFESETNDD